MILYKYDKETKEYLGYFEAYIDQLETIKAGKDIYVIPPFSTPLVPQQPKEGHAVIFLNEEWEEVEDNRGLTVYNKNGESLLIKELGPIPEGYKKEKPVTLRDIKDQKLKELTKAFEEAWNTKVKVRNIEGTIEDAFKFTQLLARFEGFKKISYKDGNSSVIAKREDVEQLVKKLYLHSILLVKRKGDLLKEISNCKSKKRTQLIEISFDIKEEVEKLLKLSQEEIDKEFNRY